MTRKKTFLIALLLALFTLPFLAAQAQSDTTISIGDSVSGELTADALSATYTLELKAGDAVNITLTSDDFDSYLTLSSPDAQLATDDDSAGGKNALIDYVAKADGIYTIRVDSYNQVSMGAYTLTVASDSNVISASPSVVGTPPAVVTVSPGSGAIAYGESVNGTLTANQTNIAYNFTGKAGDHVVITLTSPDFDAYLSLQNTSGDELANDDDSAGNLNARIDTVLPADGDYAIIAGSTFNSAAGDFTLELALSDAPVVITLALTPTTTPPSVEVTTPNNLAYGQTFDSTLSADEDSVAVTFTGKANDAVVITLTSNDFDAYVTLQDANGKSLAEDDDSAGSLNARIEYTLPADGTYTIQAGSSFGSAAGNFSLQLDAANGGTIAATGTPVVIQATPQATSSGATLSVSSALTDSQPSAYYGFNGSAGDVISVTLTSTDFDAYLIVQDASGKSLVEDDDSGGNLNASISNFTLPSDGAFTVVATSNTRAATGEFVITVSGAVLSPVSIIATTPEPEATVVSQQGGTITLGIPVNGSLSDAAPSASYTFTASGADTISITLTSDDFDTYLSLQDASGKELTTDDDSAGNLNSRIENYTLPGSGTYTIEVVSAGGVTTGNFTLVVNGGGAIQPTVEPTTQPTSAPTSQPNVIQPGGTLHYGDSASGSLVGDQATATYRFTGRTGDSVTFTLTSDDFDPYLTITDTSGNVVAEDDDSAGNLNARIANFVLPSGTTYTIVVGSSDNSGRGGYTLTVERAAVLPPTVEPTVQPTAQPTASPSGSAITVGQSVTGSLEGDQSSAVYTFEGEAGQHITIRLTSTDFDTYVLISDSSLHLIASDDDSGGNLNALLEDVELPKNDSFVITVGSFDNTGRGSYTLSVEAPGSVQPTPQPTAVPTATPTTEPNGSTLIIGSTVSGTLGADQTTAAYTFQGEIGQTITISLVSSDFDSYLRLQDSSGHDLITDDDSGGGLDARINVFTLPANDTYTIVVESYKGDYGSYTLSLSEAVIENIEYGQIIQGNLSNEGDTITYRFNGSADDVVSISLISPDFDTYLSLSDTSSTSLITNDDGGSSGTNSMIGPYTLSKDGVYYITVSSYDSTDTGRFTLTFNKVTLTPIALGDSVDVTFSSDVSAYYYQFDANNGDVINVTVDSGGSIDTSLLLNGPDGYEVIFDADGGAGFEPEIFHQLLSDNGSYILVLQAAVPGDSGHATLSLTKVVSPTLDDGPQQVRLSSSVTQDVVTFTGHAGEEVRLTAAVTGGNATSPSLTITQNGNDVASAYGTSVSGLSIQFTVPEDGSVSVQLSDYSYNNVAYEVSLERISP